MYENRNDEAFLARELFIADNDMQEQQKTSLVLSNYKILKLESFKNV